MTKRVTQRDVENELAKPGNERVVVALDETTGNARAFMAPVPYWEQDRKDKTADNESAAGDTGRLSAAEQEQLEGERADLIRALGVMSPADRAKARHRIKIIEDDLRRARAMDDNDRVSRERAGERERQQGDGSGPSAGNAQLVEVRSALGAAPKSKGTTKRGEMDPLKHVVTNLSPADQSVIRNGIRRESAR